MLPHNYELYKGVRFSFRGEMARQNRVKRLKDQKRKETAKELEKRIKKDLEASMA